MRKHTANICHSLCYRALQPCVTCGTKFASAAPQGKNAHSPLLLLSFVWEGVSQLRPIIERSAHTNKATIHQWPCGDTEMHHSLFIMKHGLLEATPYGVHTTLYQNIGYCMLDIHHIIRRNWDCLQSKCMLLVPGVSLTTFHMKYETCQSLQM